MRKVMTFVAAICCMMFSTLSVTAADLEDGAIIKIGDTQITADNKNDVKDALLTDGKISYDDGTHTLTLSNARIEYKGSEPAVISIDASAVGADITIKIEGTSGYIKGTDAIPLWLKKAASGKGLVIDGEKDAEITFYTYGSGSFKAGAIVCREDYSKTDEETFYPLTIKNGVCVHAENFMADGESAITCHHIVLSMAKLGIHSYDKPVIYSKVPASDVFQKVCIIQEGTYQREYDYYTKDYPVWIGKDQLNEKKNSVSDAVYNEATRTLTLSNINLSVSTGDAAIVIDDQEDATTPVRIVLEGTGGKVEGTGSTMALLCKTPVIIDKQISSVFSFEFSAEATAIKHLSTLTITGEEEGLLKIKSSGSGNYGIHGDGANAKLIIDGTRLNVNGQEACIYEPAHELKGVKISEPSTAEWADGDHSPKDGSDVVKGKDLKFVLSEYTLSAVADPAAGGKVTIKVKGENKDNPYKHDGTYVSYEDVEMEAVPNEGFSFAYWDNETTLTDPKKSTSLGKSNEKFVAHFRYDVTANDPYFLVEDKKIKSLPANLYDPMSKVADLDISGTDYYVCYWDGKIYYSDENSGDAAFYSAEFDPSGSKLGVKNEEIAAQADFTNVSGMVYSEKDECLYALMKEYRTGKRCLCSIKGTEIKVAMPDNMDDYTSLAIDAAGIMYTIKISYSVNTLYSIDVEKGKMTEVGYLPSGITPIRMAYDAALDKLVVLCSGMPEAPIYMVNPSTVESFWAGNQSIMSECYGFFVASAGKAKHEIEVKVADGQESYGEVSPAGKKKYSEGAKITISATPNKGYLFDKWSDGGEQTHEITVGTEDKTYTASFKADPDNRPLNIYVCGKQLTTAESVLTSAELPEITSGSVVYDDATKTLNLNSVTIGCSTADIIWINKESDPITILVNGNCKLDHTATTGGAIMVEESNTVTIKGASGAKLEVNSSNAGVMAIGSDLVFEGVEITITGDNYGIAGENDTEKVTVRGCTMEVKGAGAASVAGLAGFTCEYCEITAPTGAKYEESKYGVAVSGALTKDKIKIKSDPVLRPAMVEEGTGSFTLQKEGDDHIFTDLGWFKNGDKVTITAVPAKGYVFVRWTDDANWQDEDEEKRKGDKREITFNGSTPSFKALFCYETESAATWHGVNNSKFISFPISEHGRTVTKATSPSASKVKAGDWMNNTWYYLDNTTVKAMPYSEINDEGNAIEDEADIKSLLTGVTTAVTDVTYNFSESKFYAVAGQKLYEVITDEGEEKLEQLGEFYYKSTKTTVVSIAVDAAGSFYVLAAGTPAALFTFGISDIDTEKGKVVLTPVGDEAKEGALDQNVTAGVEQSIAFDHVTGELFWGAADYLRLISLTENRTYIVGDFGQKVIKSLHKKDRRISVTVKVADGQSEYGTVKISGKSGKEARIFAGASVTIEAVANSGYKFEKWTYGDSNENTNSTLTQKLTSARTYTAHFVKATGLDEVDADAVKSEVGKVMIDGVIYIIRDGRIYNIAGQLVK